MSADDDEQPDGDGAATAGDATTPLVTVTPWTQAAAMNYIEPESLVGQFALVEESAVATGGLPCPLLL